MKKGTNSPDLDGFPIIRIDQIPCLDTELLDRALVEVVDLIDKMRAEDDKSQKSLLYYLNRQLAEMQKEVTKRLAEERVLAMLNGTEEELKVKDRPFLEALARQPERNISTSMSDQSHERTQSTRSHSEPTPKPRPVFQAVPLPSEIRKKQTEDRASNGSSVKPIVQSVEAIDATSVLSSRSNDSYTRTSGTASVQDYPSSPNPSLGSSHPGRPPRRPKSGQPTRRSMQALEQNFGTAFVVGATERKKRFYPKKVVKETEAEIKARARESRRQLAMKRLLERKERQRAKEEASKKRKLVAMSKQKKTTKGETLNSSGLSESSDSESVSGGDDDDDTTADVPMDMVASVVMGMEAVDGASPKENISSSPVPVSMDDGNVDTSSAENELSTHVVPENEVNDRDNALPGLNITTIPPVGNEVTDVSLDESCSDKASLPVSSAIDLSPTQSNSAPAASLSPAEKEQRTLVTKNMAALSKLRKMKEDKARLKRLQGDGDASTQEEAGNSNPSDTNIDGDQMAKETSMDIENEKASFLLCRTREELDSPLLTSQSSPTLPSKPFPTDLSVMDTVSTSLDVNPDAVVESATCTRSPVKQSDSSATETISTSVDATPVAVSMSHPCEQSIDRIPDECSTSDAAKTDSVETELKDCMSHFSQFFCQNSIISEFSEVVDGESGAIVYKCYRGPDDLPGLKAWALVSVRAAGPGDVKWTVNLKYYRDLVIEHSSSSDTTDGGMRSRLTAQRARARRTVTYGLVLLAKMCECLMVGPSIDLAHITEFLDALSEKQFREDWGIRLAKFDDLVADSAHQDELFREVTVCGNLYAVCKKLENLLRTSFVSDVVSNSRNTPRTDAVVDGPTDIAVDNSHEALLTKVETIENRDLEAGEVDIGVSDSAKPKASPSPVIAVDVASNIHDTTTLQSAGDLNRESLDDDSDEDSDDDSILPSTHDIFTSDQNKQPESSVAKCDLGQDVHIPSESLSIVPVNPTLTLVSGQMSEAIKITDVFKNISEIFPAVQMLLRDMKSGCKPGDHDHVARTLIECMTTQLKLYDEWIEVMDDYATVFCHDREKGIPSQMDREDNNSLVYSGGTKALHYRVKSSRPEVANIVTDVFNNILHDWTELPQGLGLGTSWNILWSWAKPRINLKHLLVFQKVNHFHDSKQLTRKDLLKKNLQRLTDVLGSKVAHHFEIMPKTFLLPNEYTSFVREYTAIEAMKNDPDCVSKDVKNIWIMKPVGLSRGRGISLVQDISSLTYSQASVLQKYVDRPLCLGGYKFDLRLYVLVTSFRPLEAFIYNDGFARISTQMYKTDAESLANKFIHLTNSSIQKHNAAGPSMDNPLTQGDANESNGSKIGLRGERGLWSQLRRQGVNIDNVWDDICLLVVKSLVAVDDKMKYQPCCFELFGYDVLLDEDLRPWLIEVNASPSLARETQLDVRVKNALIRDIVQLIDPPPYDRAALASILRKRLKDIQMKKFSMASGDPLLEKHLKMIIGDHIPRRYGEEPKNCGGFERLCPDTKMFNLAVKLKSRLVKGIKE